MCRTQNVLRSDRSMTQISLLPPFLPPFLPSFLLSFLPPFLVFHQHSGLPEAILRRNCHPL